MPSDNIADESLSITPGNVAIQFSANLTVPSDGMHYVRFGIFKSGVASARLVFCDPLGLSLVLYDGDGQVIRHAYLPGDVAWTVEPSSWSLVIIGDTLFIYKLEGDDLVPSHRATYVADELLDLDQFVVEPTSGVNVTLIGITEAVPEAAIPEQRGLAAAHVPPETKLQDLPAADAERVERDLNLPDLDKGIVVPASLKDASSSASSDASAFSSTLLTAAIVILVVSILLAVALAVSIPLIVRAYRRRAEAMAGTK